MSPSWSAFSPQQKAVAAQLFDALCARDGLGRAEAAPRVAIDFGTLYACATEPERPLPDQLVARLEEDADLAADFRRLLAKTAAYHGPRLAAASSGTTGHRAGSGFTIDLRPSRAEPAQTYVVIALAQAGGLAPRSLFVSQREDRLIKQALPPAQGDTIQLLIESDSALAAALRDPQSEVFLR